MTLSNLNQKENYLKNMNILFVKCFVMIMMKHLMVMMIAYKRNITLLNN